MILRRILLDQPGHSVSFQCPIGLEALRHQIARRALSYGCEFSEDEVIVTVGSTEALSLALRAATNPGDTVAVESPSSFSILQAIDSLDLEAVEIPADPETGPDLDFLDHAAGKNRVAACVATTNCQNPLGYTLSDERKSQLVEIVTRHDIPLIENDVYGDLAFGPYRPKPAKAFDLNGQVMLISSFSRLLAPGFRVGWVSPGRFGERTAQLKFTNTLATPSLLQMAIARFLESGGYDRHLRRLCQSFEQQTRIARDRILGCFPTGTRVTTPQGSFLLWVGLPGQVRAIDLYQKALQSRIGILPGDVFSPTHSFANHIRISCGHKWSDRFAQGIARLGALCHEMV
jgi:DNA-binding transcriptional MocR family regulator